MRKKKELNWIFHEIICIKKHLFLCGGEQIFIFPVVGILKRSEVKFFSFFLFVCIFFLSGLGKKLIFHSVPSLLGDLHAELGFLGMNPVTSQLINRSMQLHSV